MRQHYVVIPALLSSALLYGCSMIREERFAELERKNAALSQQVADLTSRTQSVYNGIAAIQSQLRLNQ